jgi:hypothetical protein
MNTKRNTPLITANRTRCLAFSAAVLTPLLTFAAMPA